MLLARTDPSVPKHKGLTYFILDMQAPGVTVRPLVQITGDAEFNEVFFDNVRVPDSMRVGPEGDGWRVAITTLMNERVSLSGAGSVSGDTVGGSPLSRLLERHKGVTDPIARQHLSQAYIESRLIRLNNERAAAKRKSGAEVGPEGSITKLMSAEFNQRLQNLAVDLEGVIDRPVVRHAEGDGSGLIDLDGRRVELELGLADRDGLRRSRLARGPRLAGARAARREGEDCEGGEQRNTHPSHDTTRGLDWISACGPDAQVRDGTLYLCGELVA